MFGAAQILSTEMVLGTAFINIFVKPVEPELRRIVLIIGRPIPILASFSDARTAHIGLAGNEEDSGEDICEAANLRQYH